MRTYKARLRRPHYHQRRLWESRAKRKIIRAGRRSGKTTGVSGYAVLEFLDGLRVLYATPTADQLARFWFEIGRALAEPLANGVLYQNKTEHYIEVPGTENRIRAKTAWNAETMRGDYADVLIYDEFQLMNEESWTLVGAPMLLDNNGDAIFIYTPPSLQSKARSKARDPMYVSKLYKRALADTTGRWAAFHFTSYDNPYISKEALEEITEDMTLTAIRQEIEALDVEDNPRALWERQWIDNYRTADPPDLAKVVVGVDPSGTSSGDAIGILVVGAAMALGKWHIYVLEDLTLHGKPAEWGRQVVAAYHKYKADSVVAESNFGGDMVEHTIHTITDGGDVPVKLVHASRGKAVRAEPVSVLYKNGRGHHVGLFAELEDEMCTWEPGMAASPNRLDALVWAATDMALEKKGILVG